MGDGGTARATRDCDREFDAQEASRGPLRRRTDPAKDRRGAVQRARICCSPTSRPPIWTRRAFGAAAQGAGGATTARWCWSPTTADLLDALCTKHLASGGRRNHRVSGKLHRLSRGAGASAGRFSSSNTNSIAASRRGCGRRFRAIASAPSQMKKAPTRMGNSEARLHKMDNAADLRAAAQGAAAAGIAAEPHGGQGRARAEDAAVRMELGASRPVSGEGGAGGARYLRLRAGEKTPARQARR